MAEDRQKLNLLLEFIKRILDQEGNQWFCDELSLLTYKRIFQEKDGDIKFAAMEMKEIGSVERYIEKEIIPVIDYSYITEDYLRLALRRDSIEMGKYRFGHETEKNRFINYCKYAHFQFEGIINYYYRKNFKNNLDKIAEFIEHNPMNGDKFPFEFDKTKHDEIWKINHMDKFKPLEKKKYINRNDYFRILDIKRIRDQESHRDVKKNKLNKKTEEFQNDCDFNYVHNLLDNVSKKLLKDIST